MKYKPGQIDWSKPEDEQTDHAEQPETQQPKTRHNKCQPWHELHRKAIDKTDPKLYPNLYETKGKKRQDQPGSIRVAFVRCGADFEPQ
jgi:hypothetical protein